MVDAIDDVTFSSSGSLGRSNSIPKGQRDAAIKDLDAAYLQATGEKMANAGMQVQLRYVLALTKLLGHLRLYKNGVFQPQEAGRYAARLSSLDKGTLTQWRMALEKIAGESLETGPVAWALLVWRGYLTTHRLRPAHPRGCCPGSAHLDRARSRAGVRRLGTDNIDLTFATLSLLGADGLFVADRFQEDVFGKALPIAERLILEAKRKGQ